MQRAQKRQALADVLIRELDGPLVPNAVVTVVWSGASPPKTETVTTGSNGVASSFSNRVNPGTFIATITNVSCSGCFYDSAANLGPHGPHDNAAENLDQGEPRTRASSVLLASTRRRLQAQQ